MKTTAETNHARVTEIDSDLKRIARTLTELRQRRGRLLEERSALETLDAYQLA